MVDDVLTAEFNKIRDNPPFANVMLEDDCFNQSLEAVSPAFLSPLAFPGSVRFSDSCWGRKPERLALADPRRKEREGWQSKMAETIARELSDKEESNGGDELSGDELSGEPDDDGDWFGMDGGGDAMFDLEQESSEEMPPQQQTSQLDEIRQSLANGGTAHHWNSGVFEEINKACGSSAETAAFVNRRLHDLHAEALRMAAESQRFVAPAEGQVATLPVLDRGSSKPEKRLAPNGSPSAHQRNRRKKAPGKKAPPPPHLPKASTLRDKDLCEQSSSDDSSSDEDATLAELGRRHQNFSMVKHNTDCFK